MFAIGVCIVSFSAGGAIGPLIGGVLLTYFWWPGGVGASVWLWLLPAVLISAQNNCHPEAGR